ncbi:pyridoxal reductase [Lindgomyces ingoldianus]|uniref:Pyridoxal reductase n=1 Tax=Lindgomyces ingoldianus TaxID=673940 RepID=A0ACB6R651_9PLEO|nr:pyridoxal reductase [Lindgomyces ingoldianus]KAF2474661.1 pyridoxal reductase [Lindgomyces ingoldianus]
MPQIMNRDVGPVGFGLMSLTNYFKPIPREQAFAAMRAAIESGCTLWDGGEHYGTPDDNSLTLLNEYYKKYPEDAEKVVLNIKGAMEGYPSFKPLGSRAKIRESVEGCLARLGSKGKIDMFEPARRDKTVPYEETLNALKELQDEGKIGGIALSEVNANTIREASKHVKIVAVEIEVSLFHTEALTNGITATCKELDIPIIAYSPIARGLLTNTITATPDDFRQMLPQFQAENISHNQLRVKAISAIAERKNCTPAQLSLAWVLALNKREDMPTIVPIPGTGNPERVKENAKAADVELSQEDIEEIDEIVKKYDIKGDRYPSKLMEMTDA